MRLSSCLTPLLLSGLFCVTSFSPAHAAKQKSDPQLDYQLLNAAATGDTMMVRRLVPRGANLEVRDGQNGFTPLMWASWRAQIGTMRELIARGAQVNARTTFAQPKALILRGYSIISTDQQNVNGVAVTSALGAGYGALNDGITPLLLASASGSAIAVKTLLEKGANPNAVTASGETPLDAAAAAGYLPSVQALLKRGAQVNTTDSSGGAPLVNAVLQGHTPVVKELLKAGATLKGNWRGYNALQLAQMLQRRDMVPLLVAVSRREASKVKRIRPAAKSQTIQSETVKVINSNGSVEVVQ